MLLLCIWKVLSSKLCTDSNSSEFFLGFSQYLQENWVTYLLTYLLTYFKVWCPSESNSSSATQIIPHILWSLQFHSPVHKSLPFVPIMNQMNTVHALPPFFFKIHFNTPISCHLRPGLPNGFLQIFSEKLCMHFSSSYMPVYLSISSSLTLVI